MAGHDSFATRLTAAGAVSGGRARLHSIHWVGAAGAGTITLTDGNGGASLATFDIPAGATLSGQIYVGEENGILAINSLYCSVMSAGSATFIYSGIK